MRGSCIRFGARSRLATVFLISAAWILGPATASSSSLAAQEPEKGKAAEKPAAKAKAKASGGVEWLTLELGLVQVREKRLPALVLFDSRSAGAAFFDDHLADSGVKDVLKHFVLIRVSHADLERPYPVAPSASGAAEKKGKTQGPPNAPAGPGEGANAGGDGGNLATSVGAKIGLGGERSALIALSYWEEAVLSYVGDLPTRTKVKTELTRIWKVNQIYANEAKKVEPELEKSRYAAKLMNQRDAVLKVRDLEDAKAQNLLDPVLKKKVNELIQDYRAKAQKAMSEADNLDAAKKYMQAIAAFDKIAATFPFQDVMQQANKRKGECLRKLTFGA